MALQQVPTIDIAPFLNGDDKTKKEVAELVRQACEDIGFFVITGHGVAPGLTKKTLATSRLALNFKKMRRPL